MTLSRIAGLLMIVVLALMTGACTSGLNSSKAKALPLEPPKALPLPSTPPPQEGSLWTPKDSRGLLSDLKACNVGDIVTVLITENNQAADQALTQADKASGVKVGITSLLGLRLPQMKTFNNNQVAADNAIEAAVGNTFKGSGNTTRQSSFTSSLTTQVIQVLPNNNLVIQGSRHMKINNETEVVTLTGIIRPDDLTFANQVPSTAVAEARIEITGYGVVADKQRQGWFTRILDHVWPW